MHTQGLLIPKVNKRIEFFSLEAPSLLGYALSTNFQRLFVKFGTITGFYTVAIAAYVMKDVSFDKISVAGFSYLFHAIVVGCVCLL